MSPHSYCLALCAPYNAALHGPAPPRWEGRDELLTGFLSLHEVSLDEFYSGFFAPLDSPAAAGVKLEVVARVPNDAGYAIALPKTHYIRLLQRGWRRRRESLLRARARPRALFARSLAGEWTGLAARV